MEEIILKSKEDTKKLAEKIANSTKSGDIITLKGTLGAGKTFFVNSFINAIFKKENKREIVITSPTFNIVKSYNTNNFDIYHFDLYRLKNEDELYELDLENAFKNVSLIEWPEIAENVLPYRTMELEFKLKENFRICFVKLNS